MPTTKTEVDCIATAAKPLSVMKTAATTTMPPASEMAIAHPRWQELHRAGISRQESHLRKKEMVGSRKDGQRYMRRLTFEFTGKPQPLKAAVGFPVQRRVRPH